MNSSTKLSKTVIFNEAGSPDVLTLAQVEVPFPGAQEVRIQVKSIGINRADAMYRQAMYVESPVFPAQLGYEAAGIIEAVGAEVSGLAVGDMVNVIPAFSLHQYASYGEYIIMPAYAVTRYPANLSSEEAASLWTSYLSMYGMLIHSGQLQKNQFVLINAASSSTGLAAIQITNYAGGVSIALTTSPNKKEALLAAGAAYVIVSSEEDVESAVLKITGQVGAHLILDPVVGAKFSTLLRTVAQNGKVFVYGALSKEPASFPAFEVMIKTPTIKGYSAMEILGDQVALGAAVSYINLGVAEGKLKPIVDQVFQLDHIVDSHRYLESNQQFGKIVVNVSV